MKRYLVIVLFIVSFIVNGNVLAGALLALSNLHETIPMTAEQNSPQTQTPDASEHCHQVVVTKALVDDHCQMNMGGVCDNCFTHCGGALLSVAFPRFLAQPNFLVATLPHYYTPLITSSFLRPPRAS